MTHKLVEDRNNGSLKYKSEVMSGIRAGSRKKERKNDKKKVSKRKKEKIKANDGKIKERKKQ